MLTFVFNDQGRHLVINYIHRLLAEFKARCEIFMDIFWDPWPKDLYCSDFPDDPRKCIGYREAHELPEKQGEGIYEQ